MSKNAFPKGKPLFKCEGGVTLAIKKNPKCLTFKNYVSHTSILYSISTCFMRRVAFNVQYRIILHPSHLWIEFPPYEQCENHTNLNCIP